MKQRIADMSELHDLNKLIRFSKGHGGYSTEFLDAFMNKWGLTKEYMSENQVAILEENEIKCGIFSFNCGNRGAVELTVFFVNNQLIGKGIGKKLWKAASRYALEKKWEKFELISDPNAEKFYEKMGAKKIGEVESFPGRFVPLMEFIVSKV